MDGLGNAASFCVGNSATKVYYHLDDSTTPYMSEVPVPPDRITLGDFKAVFTRKGYRYFCRRWDAQLKSEVKAELVRDQQRLQRSPANGLFELFLLSPALPSSSVAPGAGTADTLPRTRHKCGATSELPSLHPLMNHHPHHYLSALALSSIVASDSSELLNGADVEGCCADGGQRVSMVTGTASSGTNTLISKRAGENLAELYNSTSEDPYNRTSLSSSAIFLRPKPGERSFGSSTNRPLIGRPKRRKARHRRPYVPSTISSATDESSSSLPRIEEVKLRLQDAHLGLSVASQDGSIFIYSIQPGSAAEKCGHLEIGDQIVQIEETKFEELSEKQALDMLRRLNSLKKTVTIYVAKRRPLNVGGSSSDKSDALSQFCETIQLDIGQWVESTKQSNVEPVLPFVDVPVGSSTNRKNGQDAVPHHRLIPTEQQMSTEEKGTSDEEQAAYMDRRNGIGPRLVPAVQKAKLQQQKALLISKTTDEQHRQSANNNKIVDPVSCHAATAPSVPVPLHATMEPSVILRRMAHPRSGLDIRNRKWLKIPVPNSFIGDDMLDWLMCNVQGFRDRKCAKAFASTVLLNGLIKHVVNISAFNEKCYYIFDDFILAERLHILRREAQQNKQGQKAETSAKGSDNGNDGGNNEPSNKQQHPPESNTEITYMSSPSSPFLGAGPTHAKSPQLPTATANNKIMGGGGPPPQLVIANNPKYTQRSIMLSQPPSTFATNGNLAPLRHFANKLPAWPISPIPCERDSPEASNEYESMVQGEVNCGAQFDAKFDGLMVPNTANKSPNFVTNTNSFLLLSPHTSPLPSVSLVPQRQNLKIE